MLFTAPTYGPPPGAAAGPTFDLTTYAFDRAAACALPRTEHSPKRYPAAHAPYKARGVEFESSAMTSYGVLLSIKSLIYLLWVVNFFGHAHTLIARIWIARQDVPGNVVGHGPLGLCGSVRPCTEGVIFSTLAQHLV